MYSGDWIQQQIQIAVDADDRATLNELFELDVDQIAPYVLLAMLQRSRQHRDFKPRAKFVTSVRARFARIQLPIGWVTRHI